MINIDDVDFINKDGPDSVPFRIKFNGLHFTMETKTSKIEYGGRGNLIWGIVWGLQYLNQRFKSQYCNHLFMS